LKLQREFLKIGATMERIDYSKWAVSTVILAVNVIAQPGHFSYVSSGKVLHIFLIRHVDSDDPFINAIELRALQNCMYGQANPGTMLILNSRNDVG
jgi:hypothetical protein